MTTLTSHKSPYAYKFDSRTSSLVKVPEGSFNTSSIQPINLSQKSFVSFQSFRINSSLPQSSSAVKLKGANSQRQGQFLQEITSSLPKISSHGLTSSQLSNQIAAALKKSTNNTRSGSEYDLEPSVVGKKHLQSTNFTQSQKSFLPYSNKSITDLPFKHGSESSPNNQLMTSRSPAHSLISTNSPKKTIIIEEKLPLKRRALNQDIREAYRTVINSKEHGAFQDLPQKSFEKESLNASPQKTKNKKGMYIDHAKELEQREKEKEEEKLADEIKTKGVGDFRRKIALYNFIRGNYLVDPDEEEVDFKPTGTSHRKIVVPVKVEKDNKKDFMASFGQGLSSYYMQSRAQSRESLEKSEMNSRRFDDKEHKKPGEDDEIYIAQGQGNSGYASKREDTAKTKESSMEQDLKKMQELGNLLSARKQLTENEQLVFKLVKDGNEQDLSYLLAKNHELVKAEDNTKQTPLHWAIKRGYYNIVVCLCKYGADIYAADMTDRRPLDMAERLKQTEILEFLRILHKKKELEGRFAQI